MEEHFNILLRVLEGLSTCYKRILWGTDFNRFERDNDLNTVEPLAPTGTGHSRSQTLGFDFRRRSRQSDGETHLYRSEAS